MTKSEKKHYKLLTEEDMKIIQSDPVGLADYIVRNKVKESRKTALIITLILMAITFTLGVIVGGQWTKTSIPNNVVQVQVGGTNELPAENTEVEK
jgi:hypothetical protein